MPRLASRNVTEIRNANTSATVMAHQMPSTSRKMGKISAEAAKLHAESEYEKYRIVQDRLFESDFDRFLQLEGEVSSAHEE